MNPTSWFAICTALIATWPADAMSAPNRLARIVARGSLTCGIWPHVPGFALKAGERYVGFDVDVCRAVAAAIFGDAGKVRFVALARIDEFTNSAEVDLVARRLTWTPGREARSAVSFGPVTFYDGQGFLVARNSRIEHVRQLSGADVCVIDMERHAETLLNHFKDGGREVGLVLVGSDGEAESALARNRCVAWSADVSWLAAARAAFTDGPARYEILPDMISKEPLAPMTRAEDSDLAQLVRWTIYVLIEAEELGLTSRNIDTLALDSSPVRRFLGIQGNSGAASGTGVSARAVISGVGNYGEVFERNLGAGSSIKLGRGLNRLWTQGGLMYAPPLDR